MTSRPVTIAKARAKELDSILNLLTNSGLPIDGAAECLSTAWVAREEDDQIIGCVALEQFGSLALLRSLAVREDRRGRGIGQQLAQQILRTARQNGITTVYLLTETAGTFFARQFGFAPIDRADVDPIVLQSVEFTTACPDSAQAMFLSL